ncbi:DUF262 domain-containing protein [Sediminibacterium salmoneum]|uniref:DUF262 domain-containing protein n=1 Tax=Sediminibacterium salmoneum TaxID=426421 RepID=UPI00047B52D3|nr:DUF262 domain-containing protein [Sediminibacterium salmoneum]
MEVKSKQYTIEEIYNFKNRIDPKPQYQRTPVWKIDRKRLLIDSIFKGYDLPKFYLNDIKGNAFYDFEVCDGQQRLRTIWEFYEDKFSLGKNVTFNSNTLDGKKFSELNQQAQDYFKHFSLTIALIVKASHNEIRDLFARLQKGMGLNQAELRRALSTHIGSYVESIVDNHVFFKNCGFPDLRNKHQDYIDHVIAYMVNDFLFDFKGQSLKDVYVNISALHATQLIKDVANVLDDVEKINSHSVGIFRNKWAFVDSFILIYQNRKDSKKVMHKEFANAFNQFEKLRKLHNKNPRNLIEKTSPSDEDKRLYEYITSFTKDGNLKANMKRRNEAFISQFRHLFK